MYFVIAHMGKDVKQPTPIDAEEYEKFKQFVKEVHGRTRGHLATELENALRQYREGYYGGNQLQRIEDDMAAIKAMMANETADGSGTPATVSNDESTHARSTDKIDKPAPNQPRGEKVKWLVQEVIDRNNITNDSGQIARVTCRKVVEDNYSFSDDRMVDYVDTVFDEIIDEFDAEIHPQNDKLFLWGEPLQEAKEIAQKEADEEFNEVLVE